MLLLGQVCQHHLSLAACCQILHHHRTTCILSSTHKHKLGGTQTLSMLQPGSAEGWGKGTRICLGLQVSTCIQAWQCKSICVHQHFTMPHATRDWHEASVDRCSAACTTISCWHALSPSTSIQKVWLCQCTCLYRYRLYAPPPKKTHLERPLHLLGLQH